MKKVLIIFVVATIILAIGGDACADMTKTLTVTGTLGKWYNDPQKNFYIGERPDGTQDWNYGTWTADPFDGAIPEGSPYSMIVQMNASNEVTSVDYDLNGYEFSFTLPGATLDLSFYDYGVAFADFSTSSSNLIDEELSNLPFNIENWYYYGTSNDFSYPLEVSTAYTKFWSNLALTDWLNSPSPVSLDILNTAKTNNMTLNFEFQEFLSIDGTVTGATFTSVPEPATLCLLGLGGLLLRRRKKA